MTESCIWGCIRELDTITQVWGHSLAVGKGIDEGSHVTVVS